MAIHNPIMSMQSTPPISDLANTWNRRFAEPGFLFGSEPNGWLAEGSGHHGRSALISMVAWRRPTKP